MAPRARTLDTVRLTRDWDGWPAGTIGTVVAEYAETALVEVATEAEVDAHGLPLRGLLDDLVTLPYAALDIVESATANVH